MPEVIVVDEIGTEAEALACRTIAERGVTLVATAHGQFLENLMNNPMLSDLVGGLESVTLGDDTARSRNSQKSVLERRAPSTFPVLLEMRERDLWVQHDVEESVDALLLGDMPYVKVRPPQLVDQAHCCLCTAVWNWGRRIDRAALELVSATLTCLPA